MKLRIIKSVNNAKFRVHMDNMKKVVFDDSAAFSSVVALLFIVP